MRIHQRYVSRLHTREPIQLLTRTCLGEYGRMKTRNKPKCINQNHNQNVIYMSFIFLQDNFESASLIHIPRNRNVSADSLTKEIKNNNVIFFHVNQIRSDRFILRKQCLFNAQSFVQSHRRLTKKKGSNFQHLEISLNFFNSLNIQNLVFLTVSLCVRTYIA